MNEKTSDQVGAKLALKQLGNTSKQIGQYVEEWNRVLNDHGSIDLDYEFKQVKYLSEKLGDNLLEIHHKLNYMNNKK